MDPNKLQQIFNAIRKFLDFAEALEELIDPEERTLIDDKIIAFLKALVEKL